MDIVARCFQNPFQVRMAGWQSTKNQPQRPASVTRTSLSRTSICKAKPADRPGQEYHRQPFGAAASIKPMPPDPKENPDSAHVTLHQTRIAPLPPCCPSASGRSDIGDHAEQDSSRSNARPQQHCFQSLVFQPGDGRLANTIQIATQAPLTGSTFTSNPQNKRAPATKPSANAASGATPTNPTGAER